VRVATEGDVATTHVIYARPSSRANSPRSIRCARSWRNSVGASGGEPRTGSPEGIDARAPSAAKLSCRMDEPGSKISPNHAGLLDGAWSSSTR
jgi:hypothetical protein